MAHINIYSKSLCVQCDGMLRMANKAIEAGTLDPSCVTVYMMDGTEPRPGKVHESVEVIRIEDEKEQDNLRTRLRNHPGTGTSSPAVFVQETKDEKSAEIDVFSGMNPDRMKNAIKTVSANAPALAATA